MEQPPLFDHPAPETRWTAPRRAPTNARYTKYRTQGRTLCDDCVADIHARGQQGAPYPGRALWRRVDPDGTVLLLCVRHKDERYGESP